MSTARVSDRIPSARFVPDNDTVIEDLGPLGDLAGSWEGQGFNLIARPDFHDGQNLYLQLNQTHESLQLLPIGSPIPNRGFGQDDINLFGLTYLQKIHDSETGGALHIEPGIWVTQPATAYPDEPAADPPYIVARMGSIPHGNAILAQGSAAPFEGNPVLAAGNVPYNGSIFPSFNSTPFPAAEPLVFNAANSSENATANAGGLPPFKEYDLSVAAGPTNPRTPFATSPPEANLPDDIDGVPMQEVVNDPIKLLQARVQRQLNDGLTFKGTVLNVASRATVSFRPIQDDPASAAVAVAVTDGAGGVENIPFLKGGEPTEAEGPNAQTAIVYATFWIEHVRAPHRRRGFLQLQYAQMVILDFPIFTVLHPQGGGTGPLINLAWPHITVGTLRKNFTS